MKVESLMEQFLTWPESNDVRALPFVDLACVGASSGGFLSFSGSNFELLCSKAIRLRLIDKGESFGGEMSAYHIFGNTPCRDHIGGLHPYLQHQLMKSGVGKMFRKNEGYAPRLSSVGKLFDELGCLMVDELKYSLPFFEYRKKSRVIGVQKHHSGIYRVYGFDELEGHSLPYWFETEQVYLGLGGHAKHPASLQFLEGDPRLVGPLEAMTENGQRRIFKACRENPESEIHIIGTNHGAAALLTQLYLGHLMERFDIVPHIVYDANVNEIVALIKQNPNPSLPKVVLWRRPNPYEKRVAIRASSENEALAIAAEDGYTGPIYESRFKDHKLIIYNSHHALERPHAMIMLAAFRNILPGTQLQEIPAEADKGFPSNRKASTFEQGLGRATVIVKCTGIRPNGVPFFDDKGKRLPDFFWPQKSRHPLFKDRPIPCLPGVYLNGVAGAQRVEQMVARHIKGKGEDLKNGYAIGVLQSRKQGNEDLELITMHKQNIREAYLVLEEGTLFYRHNAWRHSRPTLLMLHGLGESGLCFQEAFACTELRKDFNLLVPDLLGFGRSSRADREDYALESQALRIEKLLEKLGIKVFYLAGHSMGGDVGTLLCKSLEKRVTGFVNIEGSLTLDDRFISSRFVSHHEDGDLEIWLEEEFIGKILPGWILEDPRRKQAIERYMASLRFARIEALGLSSISIQRYNNQKKTMGERYETLPQRKVYFSGTSQRSRGAERFLQDRRNTLDAEHFNTSHWVMIDRPEACYSEIYRYLQMWRESAGEE